MTPDRILLDIGGTFIKCSDGRSIAIDSAGSRESIVASLREAVLDARDVRISIPGPFDYANGIFLMKHKFAALYGESFADLVASPEGVCRQFRFTHDAVAMLLGEIAAGAGKGFGRVAIVTLGTGLGFAMSIDGMPLLNDMGSPRVPIWNLPWEGGILEDYASKRGFLRGFPEEWTVKDLAEKARTPQGGACRDRFARTGRVLAEALAPLLSEYGIECLLFGGQISRSYDLFGPELEEALSPRTLPALRHVGPVSDIDNAAFNGLAARVTLN